MSATDVFVIGGGPAGLAAAIATRQKGFRVTVADGSRPPIDKACGEALMPDALLAFERLGLSIPAGEASLLGGVRFLGAGLAVEAAFPSANGLSIRRTTLHRIMAERAAAMEIEVLWQTVVTGIRGNEVRLGNRTFHSEWIVGADGVNSRVRRWANLDKQRHSRFRYAFRRHYCARPWTDRMEIYWGKRSQAYTSPVNDEEVCVAVASHDPELRVDEGLQEFPELHERLLRAEATSTERGAISCNRKLARVWRGNIALVGDASGTVDPITGEGIGLAFHQAVALADCLVTGNLGDYEAAHRRLAWRPLMMARLMLMLDGRPWLQRRTLRAFLDRPEVFRRLLALHVGVISPYEAAFDGLTLGWGLLRA